MFYCDYPIIRSEKQLPVYLVNMGQQHCQDHIIRPEGYPHHQILYCTKGSGTLICDERKTHIPPNTAVFMPANYPHEYFAEEDVWDIHWVVPSGYGIDDMLRQFGLAEPRVCSLGNVKMLEHIFRKMHDAMKAVDHINYNYASPITMDDLCGAAGVSKQHLCLLFRNTLNMRPMEYTAKRRIQEAKALLMGTDKSIEEISEEVGFGSESYFCKLFKRYEGITPTDFRNA